MKRALLIILFICLMPQLVLATSPDFLNESISTQSFNYTGSSHWNISVHQDTDDISDWEFLWFETNYTGSGANYTAVEQVNGGQSTSLWTANEGITGLASNQYTTNATVVKDGNSSIEAYFNHTDLVAPPNEAVLDLDFNVSENTTEVSFWIFFNDTSGIDNQRINVTVNYVCGAITTDDAGQLFDVIDGWNQITYPYTDSCDNASETLSIKMSENETGNPTYFWVDEVKIDIDSRIAFDDYEMRAGFGTYYTWNDSVTEIGGFCARWLINETSGVTVADDWDCFEVAFPEINNCTRGITAYNFTLYDETDFTSPVGTMLSNWHIWDGTGLLNATYNFSETGTYSDYCIWPNVSSFYADVNITYYNDSLNYTNRNYYIRSGVVDNTTNPISLYMNSNTSPIDYFVYDEYSNELQNIIVRVARYYFDLDDWRVINMGLSDSEGKGILHLEQGNIYYRIYLYDNTSLNRTIDNIMLSENNDDIFLYIDSEQITDTPRYWTNLDITECAYNNTTMLLSCSVSDSSGTMTGAYLNVWNYTNYSEVLFCNDSGTGANVNLACNLTNTTNRNFRFSFYGTFAETDYHLDSGILEFITGLGAGTTGLLMTLLLVLVMFFIGQWNPTVAVALSTFTILAMAWVGLLTSTTGVLGLVVFGIAVILLLRT